MSSINITTNTKYVFATDWYLKNSDQIWSLHFMPCNFELKSLNQKSKSFMTGLICDQTLKIWSCIIPTNFEKFKFGNRTLSLIRHLRPAIYKSWFFLKTLGENSELEILARGTNGAFNASQIGKIDLFSLFSDICIF